MVYVLLADGFEEAEVVVPVDLLRRGGVEVRLVGVNGLQVTGSHGMVLHADMSMDEMNQDEMEMLFLPGGLGGVNSIETSLPAMAYIQQSSDMGKWLAAICAAPTILAHMGILDRRSAVCYPSLHHKMGSAVIPEGQAVVVDGRIITAQAAGCAFQFGLAMLTALKDAETAKNVADSVYWAE